MAGAQEKLARYREKRDFHETAEPAGGTAKTGTRYLIQKHAARRLHYDFRLEHAGVLLSWAVTRGPSYNTKDRRLAVRTEDHPLEYGDFEGTIPQGHYGGGTVMLWDTGSWEPLGDVDAGLKAGKLVFNLQGERLRGRWGLVRMKPRPKEKNENWLLIKEKDALANTHENLLEQAATSVVSGRAMEAIAQGDAVWDSAARNADLPDFVEPSLATLVEAPPKGEDWWFEIKYDGYRALIAAEGKAVKIYTRSGLDWTSRFSAIAAEIAKRNLPACLLDSEIVVLEADGRTNFPALVAALEEGAKNRLSCFVFDLLAQAGRDLRAKPLSARRQALQKLLGGLDKNSAIQLSEIFKGDGAALFKTACAHRLEGIIAKRADRPYRAGRHPEWQKIKCGQGQEFIIIGFSPSQKNRAFASILLAVREGGELRYVGRVGSGFSEATLDQLARWRDTHQASAAPCAVPAPMRRGVTWVSPSLVAQVEFAGWTGAQQIRQGRFMGLREDKTAAEVKREMPAPKHADIKLTHPEREIYTAQHLTKQDVADYIATALPQMFPFMENRLVSLVRAPEGAAGESFFQRHPSPGFGPAWGAQTIPTKPGKTETYLYAKAPEALLAAVQMGVLEFHLWGSRLEDIEKPDRIVFDLDPDPSVDFAAVRRAALRLRDVLGALELESLPLLSGGKGIHVVVPVTPHHGWPVVKAFAAALSGRVAEDDPKNFTATMAKAKRAGKIFIDHFRNERGSTAIAPYSPRARPGGAVAWPLSWTALNTVESADAMTLPRAVQALEAGENFWAGYAKIRQNLGAAALKALAIQP